MIPTLSDTTLACEFSDAHMCGYTISTAGRVTASRALYHVEQDDTRKSEKRIGLKKSASLELSELHSARALEHHTSSRREVSEDYQVGICLRGSEQLYSVFAPTRALSDPCGGCTGKC